MKSINRIIAAAAVLLACLFAGSNIWLRHSAPAEEGRLFRVEINRLSRAVQQDALSEVDWSDYRSVTAVTPVSAQDAEAFTPSGDYEIRRIDGRLYRFDYVLPAAPLPTLQLNVVLALASAAVLGTLLYVRGKILRPFNTLQSVPYRLAQGDLTPPVKENKNRFFGRFVWGVEMLRENMAQQKQRELTLQKEKKTLLLSLSHDIKTPLSAIKLYGKALERGLYADEEKQRAAAHGICDKAAEIEALTAQINQTLSEDFLQLSVQEGEFYQSALLGSITAFYAEKLALRHTQFTVEKSEDCLLRGDEARAAEVLQNVMENAVKYGDGVWIKITFREEENCRLITVSNSGCTLPQTELPHLFESFWRGSNAQQGQGSGLGLYISRSLMQKMGGEIFAEIHDGTMSLTAVFEKA